MTSDSISNCYATQISLMVIYSNLYPQLLTSTVINPLTSYTFILWSIFKLQKEQ